MRAMSEKRERGRGGTGTGVTSHNGQHEGEHEHEDDAYKDNSTVSRTSRDGRRTVECE